MTAKTATRTTGGVLLIASLKALGLRTVFGVPGGQTLAVTDAILDDDSMEFVTARHEGAAACMADAVGRLTRQPGVCLATTGPGATNLLTGIGGAFRDSSPVIAITCNNRLGDLDKDEAQGADHISIFRPLVKWAKLVSKPESIRQAVEEAYLRAVSGCPGPVLLDFARDAIEVEVPKEWIDDVAAGSIRQCTQRERPQPDPARVAAAIDVLVASERPTVWIGNGVKSAYAGDIALDLAECLDAPLVTTFNGIGAVRTSHDLVYGALTRMGTRLSSRVLADSDALVVVGNSLNAVSTGRWSMRLPDTIIQIDIDPSIIGRYYADRTLGICADVVPGLLALTEGLRMTPPAPRIVGRRRKRLTELSQHRTSWWMNVADGSAPTHGAVSPPQALAAVRRVVSPDTIVVFDAGNPGVWSYAWEILEPDTYLKPVGFGNMGFALPGLIGASKARPGVPLLGFVGDGSLGMSLGELETLARERVDAVLIVLNDSAYGNIRQEQIVHLGPRRLIGVDLGNVNFAQVAQGCGIPATRANDIPALLDAVRQGVAVRGPFLVDVAIDPDVNAWTYGPFQPYEAP